MPMSKSASSSPTPRSTSRVMMMGLIGSDERTVGLVHRTTTGARLVLWNPADGILPKNLAYPTDGRVRTVSTSIAWRPRFCGPSRSAWSPRPPTVVAGNVVDGEALSAGEIARSSHHQHDD